MVTIIAKHRVRNYDQWRPTFDQFQSKRNEHGVTNGRVYRTPMIRMIWYSCLTPLTKRGRASITPQMTSATVWNRRVWICPLSPGK